MKKFFKELKDTIFAGVVFLLPLLILIVLLGKAYQLLTGVSTKIASLFGVKTLLGLPGHTIASSVLILITLLVCGYLVRLTLFQNIYNWLDRKLADNLPPDRIRLLPGVDIKQYRNALANQGRGIGELLVVSP